MPDETYGCQSRRNVADAMAMLWVFTLGIIVGVFSVLNSASFPSGPAGGESHPSVIVVEDD